MTRDGRGRNLTGRARAQRIALGAARRRRCDQAGVPSSILRSLGSGLYRTERSAVCFIRSSLGARGLLALALALAPAFDGEVVPSRRSLPGLRGRPRNKNRRASLARAKKKEYGRRQQERKQTASRHGAAGRTTRRRRASSGVRRGFRAPVPGSPELKRGRPRAGPDSIAGLGRPPRASLGRGRASFGSRPRGHASRPCRPTRRPRDA